ncbi:MAG: hypothetical protein ACK4VI_08740 [Alphaproteobacteria bacterium]
MIQEKVSKAAKILNTRPDFKEKSSQDFTVINKGGIEIWPVAKSDLAPVDKKLLFISPYSELAAALSMRSPRPVWLYDRIDDIQSMNLSETSGADWVMLVCTPEDFVKANLLADRWTYGPHEVTVMMGHRKLI